jgi:hypothetical protein
LRPIDDSKESQRKKYEFHKKANGTLNYYLEQGNWIGAYVIAYSLLEDRLRAMYVVVKRDIEGIELIKDDINVSLARIVGYLKKNGYLIKELAKQLHKANDLRNTLLHDAMWQIDVIKEEHVIAIKALKNEVAKVVEQLKKKIKAK